MLHCSFTLLYSPVSFTIHADPLRQHGGVKWETCKFFRTSGVFTSDSESSIDFCQWRDSLHVVSTSWHPSVYVFSRTHRLLSPHLAHLETQLILGTRANSWSPCREGEAKVSTQTRLKVLTKTTGFICSSLRPPIIHILTTRVRSKIHRYPIQPIY